MASSIIRPANQDDINALLKLGASFHSETRFSARAYSPYKTALFLAEIIKRPLGCLLVAEREGQIIGGVAGYAIADWFTTELVATEYALFLEQDKRGGALVMRLIKDFIKWADEKGIKRKHIGIVTGINQERTERIYKRLGGEKIGVLYEFGGE